MSISSITSKIPNRLVGMSQLIPPSSRLITNAYYPNLRNSMNVPRLNTTSMMNTTKFYSTPTNDNNKKESEIPKKNVSDFDAMKLGEEKLKEQKKAKFPTKTQE